MGKIVCAIEKCSRTRENQNSGSPSQRISFFSFPKEEDLLDKWLEFINRHNVNKLDKETLDRKRLRLCHLHFQRKDIAHKGRRDSTRTLMRNSVPERHAGVLKPKRKSTKNQSPATPNKASPEPTPLTPPPPATTKSPTTTTSPAGPTGDDASKPPDSAPLYHSINGYVVDLRFASQLEMFRLPNGKLIQVRKQAKKAPTATTAVSPSASDSEVALPPEQANKAPTATTTVSPAASDSEVVLSDCPIVSYVSYVTSSSDYVYERFDIVYD